MRCVMNKDSHLIKAFWVVSIVVLLFAITALWFMQSAPASTAFRDSSDKSTDAKQVEIDLDKAVEVALPQIRADLKPELFKTADGKNGWVIRIPGSRPISTPAYSDGKIFVGGGYGSHEFYAFDAQTGAMVWKMKTSDDGPTAAVVEDGYVAFNTESCTVIVCDPRTGKVIWQEWLGDPLMSQPAISKGRLYIAHPAGQRGRRGTGHRLLCADLKTGRHIWDQAITADVVSAPVVSGDKIFLTCFDGASFCLNAADGAVVWKKQNAATSAPVIAGGQVVVTQKESRDGKAYEGMKRVDARGGDDKDKQLLASSEADYLKENKGGGVAMSEKQAASLDSSVGFASAPPAAKIEAANKHLGVNTVAGGWAYQGSRAAHKRGQMMNAQGKYINSVRLADGLANWRAEVKGAGVGADSQVFSPPALGESNMYLSSALGHILSVSQQDGTMGFMYWLKQPMVFQPALALGNVYVGTTNGLLICLKTGSKDADGWYAWGGNAQHNKNE
jgi:Ca-activated chloride channel homolog